MPEALPILDQVKKLRRFAIRSVDHGAVLANLDEDGGMSVRYGAMTALSCGIAILGLLLSSPAAEGKFGRKWYREVHIGPVMQ